MFKLIVIACAVSCIFADAPVPSYAAPPAPAYPPPKPAYPPPPQYKPYKPETKPIEGKLKHKELGKKAYIEDFPAPAPAPSKYPYGN
ncbi:UNVERIFIED_CONTAM: hypothetical protein RMT77_018601 [Armadillidium vulgare]